MMFRVGSGTMHSSPQLSPQDVSKGNVCFSKESQQSPCSGGSSSRPSSPCGSPSSGVAKKCELAKPEPPKQNKSKNPFCQTREPKYQDPCFPPKSCLPNNKAVPVEDPCMRKSCKPPMRVPGDPLYRTSTCCTPQEPVLDCAHPSGGSQSSVSFNQSATKLISYHQLSPSGSSNCSCNSCKGKSGADTFTNTSMKISPPKIPSDRSPKGSLTKSVCSPKASPSKVPCSFPNVSPKTSHTARVRGSDVSMCDSCKQNKGDDSCDCDNCQASDNGKFLTRQKSNGNQCNTCPSSGSPKHDIEIHPGMATRAVSNTSSCYDSQKENEIYSTPVQEMVTSLDSGYLYAKKEGGMQCKSCSPGPNSGALSGNNYYTGQQFQQQVDYTSLNPQQYYDDAQQFPNAWHQGQLNNTGGFVGGPMPSDYFNQMSQQQDDCKSKKPGRRCNISLNQKPY